MINGFLYRHTVIFISKLITQILYEDKTLIFDIIDFYSGFLQFCYIERYTFASQRGLLDT